MLGDVDVDALSSYLDAAGWLAERRDVRRSIWRHPGGQRVFVPGAKGPDFHELVVLAVRGIAVAEQREVDDVEVDVMWKGYDKLHLRRMARASALTLMDALDLHQALHDTVLAAARASVEPRKLFAGRRPRRVDEYIEKVRIVPSVPGSFVVRALLPLSTEEPFPGHGTSDTRAVATTLLQATDAAVRTAAEVAERSEPRLWDDAVPEGVSANICDGLARLPGDRTDFGGAAELSIDWTWTAPAELRPPIEIPTDLRPVLAAGSAYLRGEPEEYHVRATGLVTKLHREPPMGPGEITVRGYVEGWDAGSRALRFSVDERTYGDAISAHEAGSPVRVTALVERTPRGINVIRVEDLEQLSSPGP